MTKPRAKGATTPAAAADPTAMTVAVPTRGDGWDEKQSARLLELAVDRSEGATRERMKILRAAPVLASELGDLARQLESNLTSDIGADVLGDAALVHCENMRHDLGYSGSGMVERLIIDRVILTWLHLYTLEMRRRRVWKAGDTLIKVAWYDAQVDRANNAHLRALSTLARVRRLSVNIGQVNIAHGDQVNNAAVIGGAAGGGTADP